MVKHKIEGQRKFDPKREFIKITKFIYERRLTYATGGNWALRYDNKYYCTPTGLGRYYLYELEEEDIIVCDKNKNIIEIAKNYRELYDKLSKYTHYKKSLTSEIIMEIKTYFYQLIEYTEILLNLRDIHFQKN